MASQSDLNMKISVIIRTYNEQKYLDELLTKIFNQELGEHSLEVVVIDSGSTDSTLEILSKFNVVLTHIKKSDFTFGRSLNMACDVSSGDILVFISGHCIPVDNKWLYMLVEDLATNKAVYSYGRQIGRDTTKFSEEMIFSKYYPDDAAGNGIEGFCNNANSAILSKYWQIYKFDEDLTGLEDMHLARKLVEKGLKVSYRHQSAVFHIHSESFAQTKNRYEREAYAMREIFPEINITYVDLVRYLITSIFSDFKAAIKMKKFLKNLVPIVLFRLAQYVGSFRGNQKNYKLTEERKEKYFYPK